MALTTPPTADDIAKRQQAAAQLPSAPALPSFPGSDSRLAGVARVASTFANPLPAGASAIGNRVVPAVGSAVTTAGGLFDAPGTPNPAVMPVPTKAADAASGAANDAIDAAKSPKDYGFDYSGSTNTNAVPAGAQVKPVDPSENISGWNTFVQRQLSNMTGMSPEQTKGVLAQPLPAWNNHDQQNTTTGAPQHLNYGYGSEIIGSGAVKHADGRTTLNNFSGVGQGAMPAGAAGVFGPAGGSTASNMQAQLFSTMQQAAALRAQGRDLEAHKLEAQVSRFSPAVDSAAMLPVRQQLADASTQTAATGAGDLKLRAQVAQPGYDLATAFNDAWGPNGSIEKQNQARAAMAAHQGQNVKPNTVGAMTWMQDPSDGAWKWMPFAAQAKK